MTSKKMIYPKVLIFGYPFDRKTGGGITMSNIFEGWPKEKLAVASPRIDKSGADICTKYYRLGYDENKYLWPFNLLQQKYASGSIELDEQEQINEKSSMQLDLNDSKYNSGMKSLVVRLLHFFGLYYLIYKVSVSKKFEAYIKEFQPDVIYTQLAKLEYIDFLSDLLKKYDIPLVIHIMDDWPIIINKPGLFSKYWGKRIDNGFRFLLKKAKVNMSICKAMSDEYKQRYGHDFIPFHNAFDRKRWMPASKDNYSVEGTFKILYAGRIGLGTHQSVYKLMKAVHELGQEGADIEFQLQSRQCPDEFEQLIESSDFIIKNEQVAYEDLPKRFASVDSLVLPMDFDEENLDFIHLSMPTKVPEYMISGTPILVFAHSSTALVKYAKESSWGVVVEEDSIDKIKEAIKLLMNEENLRQELGTHAKKIALERHDRDVVREQFRQTIVNVL